MLMILGSGYGLWRPGLDIQDGRHDRRHNGMWLQHGWLGADAWFIEHRRQGKRSFFRDRKSIEELATKLRNGHISDLYPHLCPAQRGGAIPAVDDAQTERFLDACSGMRVLPWVGGKLNSNVFPANPEWRSHFEESICRLLHRHPRLLGVHVNIEPWPDGNTDLLKLLDELHTVLPTGCILSVAAMPPHVSQVDDPHWDEAYFRRVAGRVDQLAVMMYDTALQNPKRYEALMADWTVQIVDWSETCPEVLLSVPAYDDVTLGHNPKIENMHHALFGIHAGLMRQTPLPRRYRGVAVYCEWQMTQNDWSEFNRYYLAPD